jgi:hypothetical protein
LSSSAKADDPVTPALTQYPKAGVYWMPAYAGMTSGAEG